jgi:uncharacterized protein YjiK
MHSRWLPNRCSKPARRSRFALRWYSWLLLVVVAAYGLAFAMHWDDRGVLWVRERSKPGRAPGERLAAGLSRGHRRQALPGMEKDEASDLAYNPQTKTLFSVMGKNPFLVELTLQGDVLRKMPLVGWSNPEGVTVLENGLMAIVDEREHLLTIVKVDADTRELNIADFPKYDLGPSKDQNKAFEGVTWDSRNQQLMLGEERPPALFTWKSDGSQLTGDKQKLPVMHWTCATSRPWPSTRAPAHAGAVRRFPPVAGAGRKGRAGQLHDPAGRLQWPEKHHSPRRRRDHGRGRHAVHGQ